ncbi:unnamed protein product [Anisakis simplex]|uniref:ZM domain-containing protein n=1 Tax=Anisakis simplex TaxID=6269 RepID=A0A0M3JYY1_ANISI|nr:unnamed protein product [Anisakis simplex]
MRFDDRRRNRRRFDNLGREESQVVESYERRIDGTPETEPQYQHSYNTYTERRTYGRDENGEVILRIERDPKDPVRPATPVRPVTPVGDVPREMQPIQPFDTLPLTIPRIDIRNTTSRGSNGPHSYNSYHHDQRKQLSPQHQSMRSARSVPPLHYPSRLTPPLPSSHHSNVAFDQQSTRSYATMPMKKVIRKSRWVTVRDGQPVSPFVETVTYEPKYPTYDRSYRQHADNIYQYRQYDDDGERPSPQYIPERSILKSRQVSYYDDNYNDDTYRRMHSQYPQSRYVPECAYIVENPLYND